MWPVDSRPAPSSPRRVSLASARSSSPRRCSSPPSPTQASSSRAGGVDAMGKRAALRPGPEAMEKEKAMNINALNLEASTHTVRGRPAHLEPSLAWVPPRTKRDHKEDVPYTPSWRVKEQVDPDETTEAMVQRVQEQRAVRAVPGVQDDGTNLTGERGAQRYAEQRAVHAVPQVQDQQHPRSWIDRRCKDDNRGSARDRGHSSGGRDDPPQQGLVLRAAQAVEEKDKRKIIEHQEKLSLIHI